MDINPTCRGRDKVAVDDICGLWEVIRIQERSGKLVSHPWITDRYKFNFLPDMIFLQLKDGNNSHGTWKLLENARNPSQRYAILLDGKKKFRILSYCEEDMILSDGNRDFILIRRL